MKSAFRNILHKAFSVFMTLVAVLYISFSKDRYRTVTSGDEKFMKQAAVQITISLPAAGWPGHLVEWLNTH